MNSLQGCKTVDDGPLPFALLQLDTKPEGLPIRTVKPTDMYEVNLLGWWCLLYEKANINMDQKS